MSYFLLTTSSTNPWVVFYDKGGAQFMGWSIAIIAATIAIWSFLLMKLRELYESDEYVEILRTMRVFNPTIGTNSPLKRYFTLTWITLFAAAVSIVVQLTVGRIEEQWAAITTLSVIAIMIILFLVEVVATIGNVRVLLRISDAKINAKLASPKT